MKKLVLGLWLACAAAGLIVVILSCQAVPVNDTSLVVLTFSSEGAGDSLQIDSRDVGAQPAESLKPVDFSLEGGRKGWRIAIPGGRPIATPAYADGAIFVGGGYGSHEFYAFDAQTGELKWKMTTKDDGPTAAVVSEGCVVFNTESCTLVVADAKTGKEIWSKWLGDPLMSQPAVADGRIFMVYPGKEGRHFLACFALMKEKEIWKSEISGDAISAPVLEDGFVNLATLDGNLYRFEAATGKQLWCKKEQITSAPWMHEGKMYASQRRGKQDKPMERVMAFRNGDGAGSITWHWEDNSALYLNRHANSYAEFGGTAEAWDASVGFTAAPMAAKLSVASENVAQGTVMGCWAYQGGRPCVVDGLCYSNSGNMLQCTDIHTNEIIWKKKYKVENEEKLGWIALTPPAVVNGKMFAGSMTGELLCVDVRNCNPVWSYGIKEAVLFQPAIAKGRVYFGTQQGSIYCIETGDEKDDGWYMWGGSPSHNGPVK